MVQAMSNNGYLLVDRNWCEYSTQRGQSLSLSMNRVAASPLARKCGATPGGSAAYSLNPNSQATLFGLGTHHDSLRFECGD